ncbi:MAG: sugar phosphate nucleotidyltransferase [Candidatus Absconditabacterales bacterium]|nr:sugar phosphate nucleotidyltransferase [Candidatus Absconditabacterales bacterium]
MKAVILAAGHGTRMLPITKTIPKELLPVGNKPVIHYVVQGLAKAGISDIIIVTSSSKKALEDYFDKNYELEDMLKKKEKYEFLSAINEPKNLANICFVKQSEQLGIGHAMLTAKPWISDDFFMLVYGDSIYHPAIFSQVLDLHHHTGQMVMSLKHVPKHDVSKYGIVQIHDDHIIDFVEKPAPDNAPSTLASFSPIIYHRDIFDHLAKTGLDPRLGELYPRPGLLAMIPTYGLRPAISDQPIWDTGNPHAWLAANNDLARINEAFD